MIEQDGSHAHRLTEEQISTAISEIRAKFTELPTVAYKLAARRDARSTDEQFAEALKTLRRRGRVSCVADGMHRKNRMRKSDADDTVITMTTVAIAKPDEPEDVEGTGEEPEEAASDDMVDELEKARKRVEELEREERVKIAALRKEADRLEARLRPLPVGMHGVQSSLAEAQPDAASTPPRREAGRPTKSATMAKTTDQPRAKGKPGPRGPRADSLVSRVLTFLAKHPNSRSGHIADGIRVENTGLVSSALQALRKRGAVTSEGDRFNMTWNVARRG